jgi:hypothetical protein
VQPKVVKGAEAAWVLPTSFDSKAINAALDRLLADNKHIESRTAPSEEEIILKVANYKVQQRNGWL